MSIVRITSDEIVLCSGMSESAFGKTNYSSIITQAGVFYDGKEFSSWTFNEVRGEDTDSDDRIVVYSGKNPFSKDSGTILTLLDYFEQAGADNASTKDKELMFKAGLCVCDFLTKAALENKEIPKIGGGGILVYLPAKQENSSLIPEAQILLLPQTLYEGSVAGHNEVDYANQNGCWINTSIFDLPSICFERAVIAYKMLTGRYPFANANQQERNADILDQKFLPIELCVNGINQELAQNINKALKLNSNVVNIPGKKQKGKASEDLTPTPQFPIQLLAEAPTSISSTKLSDEELQEKANKYLKAKNQTVNAKRAIRRNVAKISIIAIATFLLIILISNYVSANRKALTSIGLTSTQTLEAFFYGINQKDTALLDNLTKGKEVKNIVNTVSRIYVVDKQRRTYEKDNGFASPANWILFIKDESFLTRTGVYGVTNLRIDGKLSPLELELHSKEDKIPPLKEEKGIRLENNMESVHQVSYFSIHSEGEHNQLYVEDITETYTLTYVKNRWIITNVETKSKNIEFDSSLFYMEYFSALRNANYDCIKATKMISIKYPWLPQEDAILKELEYLKRLAENPYLIFQQ